MQEANSLGRSVKHLQLYKVSGLNFQDNNFDNAEYGIDAVDAKFNVTKVSALNGNDFKNLRYSIAISNTTSSISIRIRLPEIVLIRSAKRLSILRADVLKRL